MFFKSLTALTTLTMCKAGQRIRGNALENSESNGFHFFEVHAPTAGFSFLSVGLLLLAAFILYLLFRRFCGRPSSSHRPAELPLHETVATPARTDTTPDDTQRLAVQQLMALIERQQLTIERSREIRSAEAADSSPPRKQIVYLPMP